MVVALVGVSIGGVENHTEIFLRVDGGDGLAQQIALGAIGADYHENAVAAISHQIEIGKPQNWRRIDKHELESFAGPANKLLPLCAGEQFRRSTHRTSSGQSEKIRMIGAKYGFFVTRAALENVRESRPRRSTDKFRKPAGAKVAIHDERAHFVQLSAAERGI